MKKRPGNRQKLRSAFLWLHRWLGLISGIVVFVVSITGCIYVFEKECRDIFQRKYYYVNAEAQPRKSLTDLKAAVERAYPKEKITFISFKERADAAVLFSTKSRKSISVNPYSARIIGIRNMEADFFNVVLRLHRTLLLHETGEEIVKWNVLIFFILCVSGLIIWWPKQVKFFKQATRINFKTKNWKRLNWDLHSVLGFYVLLVLLLISLTGMFWVFDSVRDFTRWATNQPAPVKEEKITSSPREGMAFTIDEAYHYTISQYGKGRDVFISPPQDSVAPIRVSIQYPYTLVRKQNSLQFDQYSGSVLKETLHKNYSSYDKVSRSNYQLHTGNMPGLGIGTKIIYFLASLIAASLPVTGFMIWYGRRKKSRKSVKKPSLRVAQSEPVYG